MLRLSVSGTHTFAQVLLPVLIASLLLFMVNTCLLTLKVQLWGHLLQEAIPACLLPPKLGHVSSSGTEEVSVPFNILLSSPLGSTLHKDGNCVLRIFEYPGFSLGPYTDTDRTSVGFTKEGEVEGRKKRGPTEGSAQHSASQGRKALGSVSSYCYFRFIFLLLRLASLSLSLVNEQT